jgi:Ca2+-transporting ATPase
MILLLLAVGVVYSAWGELADAATIFAVIAVLVLVEVYKEFHAKRAIAAQEQIAAPKARVVRDGMVTDIDAEAVVPGDLLVLAPGARIAADARVSVCRDVACDEAALTSEGPPLPDVSRPSPPPPALSPKCRTTPRLRSICIL